MDSKTRCCKLHIWWFRGGDGVEMHVCIVVLWLESMKRFLHRFWQRLLPSHVLNVNLLSSMKRTGLQRWACQFWHSLVNANPVARCWAVSTGPTRGCRALMPSLLSLFMIVSSETCTPVAFWRSVCRALALLLLFLKILAVQFLCVMAHLLVSAPWSWNCALRHTKPCDSTFGRAILEEMVYLCKLIWFQVHCIILQGMTRIITKHKTRDKSVKKRIKREQLSVATTCTTIPFLGVVLLLFLQRCCRFHLH